MPDTETFTQAERLLELTTPAGEDVLLIDNFSGNEAVSAPFRFNLNMVADILNNKPASVIPKNLVGQAFTVRIALEGGDERYFNGICERFAVGKTDDRFTYYTATLVPWLQLLTYNANCRIFQNQTVTDIIQAVVSAAGWSSALDVSGLTGTYTSWDYCVQYRETDFAFISRLMEAEGIFYYFAHTDSDHKMMLCDAASSYTNLPSQSTFKYSPVTGLSDLEDTIRAWESEQRIITAKYTARDYHHEMPSNALEVTESAVDSEAPSSGFEIYDYPGAFAKKFNDPAARLSDVRPEGEKVIPLPVEVEEATTIQVSGASVARAFTSGYKIKVTGGDAAGTYVLTEISHQAVQVPDYRSRDKAPSPYINQFKCIDATLPYTPAALTPKPAVYGLQTALVVDESKAGNTEEIWPDKYGRVRVRFNWDRDGKYACWLRVVQPWAGVSWGHQWIPRTGDEVAVAFLEGDPDCPIVVGSVYNATNMPMFALPDNKTQSGIVTHSSPKGGSTDANILRFEDKMSSEEVMFQAQKDLNSTVKNNETRTVKNDRTTTIHVNDSRTVETGNDTIDVQKGNRSISVDQGDTTIAIKQGKRTTTVMGDISVTAQQGNMSDTAQMGNISFTANQGNISTTADMGNIATKATMGNISTEADLGNITTEAMLGNISVKADVGNIMVQAMVGSVTVSSDASGVTISCGASSIMLTPASIMITAPMVMINS